MGIILEILTMENFRKHPTMYVGSRRFREISFWLWGIEYCCKYKLNEETPDLDGFREWLQMRLQGPGNMPWFAIICTMIGEDEDTTDKFFELLDLFLKERDENGLDKIIADHAEYEMKKYNFLSSSRLGEWGKRFS